MNPLVLTLLQIEQVRDFLIASVSPHLIVLFGSAAQQRLRPDSDLDLAFLSDQKIGDYELFLKAQQLADLMKRDVDLIDLAKASTVFKTQIIHRGQVIYCEDPTRRMNFEMRAYKEYALLNEERQEILDRIDRGVNQHG